MKLIAVFATAAFAGQVDTDLKRDDAARGAAVLDDFQTTVDGSIIAYGTGVCLTCNHDGLNAIADCVTSNVLDTCEGNENVCWYRVTYEDNGDAKRLEGGCKSDQVNISLINLQYLK